MGAATQLQGGQVSRDGSLGQGDLHNSGLVAVTRASQRDQGLPEGLGSTVDQQRVQAQQQGPMLVIPIRWGGGLSLRVVHLRAVHLPNSSTDQQTCIVQHLRPAMQAAAAELIPSSKVASTKLKSLGGDFNFVEATSLDSISSAAAQLGPEQPVAARSLHQQVPGLVDLYRQQHPQRRSYTHHQGTSAARPDRWYGRGGGHHSIPHASCHAMHMIRPPQTTCQLSYS
jgi:exonuclease III